MNRGKSITQLNRHFGFNGLYRFSVLCFILFALLVFFPLSLQAKVTGVCVNCHTMHNSQGGVAVVAEGPQKFLVNKAGCIGCHGQNPSGASNIISLGNVPQVLHAATTDLAGGNFAYITGAKTRGTGTTSNTAGHNPIDLGTNETVLTSPPGDQHTTGITNANFTCSGAKGCHGNRAVEDKFLAMKGAHHTADGVLKFGTISEDGQGGSTGLSYRFLMGVKGGEETSWTNASSTQHNEYKGATSMGASSATSPAGNTISGFCAECHGNYHGATTSEVGTASPWLRHPTDTSLPSSGEYASYTTYSVTAPVARTTIPNSPSGTVTPSGTIDDILMCLSCHSAHASPYYKMMRWDYKSATLSVAISGCNVCHTSKQ